jgi:iron complex outermembrane receptor protein
MQPTLADETGRCHRQLIQWGGALLTLCLPLICPAQDQGASLEAVVVTGSAIRRINAETAVPVSVYQMDDLRHQGISSVEQLMQSLTSAQSSYTTAQSFGNNAGGAALANMRGIGSNKTLVLLNGERIANNAVDGSAPDLNMIPFAAIDRIEVLRDGASALYGTDAIGGVINFITRRSFNGASVTAGYDVPQPGGGKIKTAQITLGKGDWAEDGHNTYGVFSVRQQDAIGADMRNYNKRLPAGFSISTYPANYSQDNHTFYNASAPRCSGANMVPLVNDGGGITGCQLSTAGLVGYTPKTETVSGLVKSNWRAHEDLHLGLEAFASRNLVTTSIQTSPIVGVIQPTHPNFPASTPDMQIDPMRPLNVYWRPFALGPRTQDNINTQHRVMFTSDGHHMGWDFATRLSFNRNQVDQTLTGGYADPGVVNGGLQNGILNPFGDQSPAGTSLLQSSLLKGLLMSSTGTMVVAKVMASRDLDDWLGAGRPAQIALGTEWRHERFDSKANPEVASLTQSSAGLSPDYSNQGQRRILAWFGELNVPLRKSLDVTGSVRTDQYSDFGTTINPKLAFRLQPNPSFLLRGSASSGFRAPSLYELYGAQTYANTENANNPINCPGGTPITGASAAINCQRQFISYGGGNTKLKPETSTNYTLGLVWEPVKHLTTSVDFWQINLKNQISVLPQSVLFDPQNYAQFAPYFHFLQPGNLLSITPNCPGPQCGWVDNNNENLGSLHTQGIDFGLQQQIRSDWGQWDIRLQSTWVDKYDYQDYPGGPIVKSVGSYKGIGPVFRWQHHLVLSWRQNPWVAGMTIRYRSGYADYDPSNTVGSYTTVDVFGGWSPAKGVQLVAGIRNLANTPPPYTNQADIFQTGGWDSRYASAEGRTFYFRGTVNF